MTARRIAFRIGVNLGDIIIQDDGLCGDGVNVAARLEGLAVPGSICVSGSVHEQVRQKLTYRFEDLGRIEVKNIAEPLHVYVASPPFSLSAPAVSAVRKRRLRPVLVASALSESA